MGNVPICGELKKYDPHDEINTPFDKLDTMPWNYPNGGLYHSMETLKNIYPDIIDYSIEEQMKYSDAITLRYALNKHFINSQLKSFNTNIEILAKNCNTTALGNLACIAFYNGLESEIGIIYTKVIQYLKKPKVSENISIY